MHYGDEKQLQDNELVVVVYKHEFIDLDEEQEENEVEYELASIQKCSYFPPRLLKKIITDPTSFFEKQMKDCKIEEWYQVTIKSTDGYKQYEITSIVMITEQMIEDNNFLNLH